MAVVTTKSTVITNRDASPRVLNDGRLSRSILRSSVGSVAVGAADSIGSKFVLCSLPSSAMVRAVLATCSAGMTTLAGDVGVYRTTADGAAVSDVDLFASAQLFSSALNRSDITNESTTYTTTLREQPLWQAAGLTADPNSYLDIVVTLTAANTGVAGTLGLEVQYVDNAS